MQQVVFRKLGKRFAAEIPNVIIDRLPKFRKTGKITC